MSYFEYCTVRDLRDEGVSSTTYTDVRVLECIRLASVRINLHTQQWFQPVVGEIYTDGTNSAFLSLPTMQRFIKVDSIEILTNMTSRGMGWTSNKVFPDKRVFDILTRDMYQIAGLNKSFIEFVTNGDAQTLIQEVLSNQYRSLWPEGRQNIKIDGVYGWLENDKEIETTAAVAGVVGDASLTVDSVAGWSVNDYAIIETENDGTQIQIVSGITGSTLLFEGDSETTGGLRWDVALGATVKTFGSVPMLIKYCAKRLAIKALRSLNTVLDPSEIIANALVSEKTDNYTYRLSDSVLSSVSGTSSLENGGTGDLECDAILTNFMTDVPPYVGFV